jgi:hypothetical protein
MMLPEELYDNSSCFVYYEKTKREYTEIGYENDDGDILFKEYSKNKEEAIAAIAKKIEESFGDLAFRKLTYLLNQLKNGWEIKIYKKDGFFVIDAQKMTEEAYEFIYTNDKSLYYITLMALEKIKSYL